MTFANSLDSDKAQQNVEPDSGFKVFDTDGIQQTTKNSEKLPSRQRVKQNNRVFIFRWKLSKNWDQSYTRPIGPRCEKTCLWGVQQREIQTRLLSYRDLLKNWRACLDIILFNTQITKALIRLHECAGWSAPVLFANHQRQVFSRRGPIYKGLIERKAFFGVCDQVRFKQACSATETN